MKRPSRLEILQYAAEGAAMLRGTQMGNPDLDEEWLEEIEAHIEWLDNEIARLTPKE